MSGGVQDPKVVRLKAELAAASHEVARLTAENAELEMLLAEQQKVLDANQADLDRYRVLVEQQRFNQPERVDSKTPASQQAVVLV